MVSALELELALALVLVLALELVLELVLQLVLASVLALAPVQWERQWLEHSQHMFHSNYLYRQHLCRIQTYCTSLSYLHIGSLERI